MIYREEDTIQTQVNFCGGVNNLTVLHTNPVGVSIAAFSNQTIGTTSQISAETAHRRHSAKLRKQNRLEEAHHA